MNKPFFYGIMCICDGLCSGHCDLYVAGFEPDELASAICIGEGDLVFAFTSVDCNASDAAVADVRVANSDGCAVAVFKFRWLSSKKLRSRLN